MLDLPRPRVALKERPRWTPEQAKAFLDSCLADNAYRRAPVFALLLTTGLRVSEALGLEWRDIDLDRRELSVRRSIVWHSGRWHAGEPKTRSSRRTIGLGEAGLEALSALDLPLRTKRGTPVALPTLQVAMERCCKRAGVPYLNVHGLRHVHAALAPAATKDFHAVSRRLGHSNVGITMQIYAYTMAQDRDVADAVDSLLRR
jgi:integrase